MKKYFFIGIYFFILFIITSIYTSKVIFNPHNYRITDVYVYDNFANLTIKFETLDLSLIFEDFMYYFYSENRLLNTTDCCLINFFINSTLDRFSEEEFIHKYYIYTQEVNL